MKHLRWPVCLLGLMAGIAGCGNAASRDPYRNLGPAREIVSTSIKWMGGYETWDKIEGITATALATVHCTDGTAYVNLQKQIIDLRGNRILASAETAEGSWKAVARDKGRCSLTAKGFQPDEKMQPRICGALWLLLERVRGPLRLLDKDQQILSAAPAKLGGEDCIRVAVHERGGRDLSYYFAQTTGELRYVTVEPAGAGQTGTLTSFTYTVLPEGVAFPSRIRVVQMGQNAPISDKPVLDVEFSEVQAHKGPWISGLLAR